MGGWGERGTGDFSVNQDVIEKNTRVHLLLIEDVRFPSDINKVMISFGSFGSGLFKVPGRYISQTSFAQSVVKVEVLQTGVYYWTLLG